MKHDINEIQCGENECNWFEVLVGFEVCKMQLIIVQGNILF